MKVRHHLSIKNKARVFRYFDEGKRPSDIIEESLTRSTLYQYYVEWRREKGVSGKATGFALKRFIKRAGSVPSPDNPVESNSNKVLSRTSDNASERENMDKFILDCVAVIEALKHPKSGTIFLPGSNCERFLADILRIKERESGRPVFLTYDRYVDLFSKWTDIARKARNKEEFYRLCANDGISYTVPGL